MEQIRGFQIDTFSLNDFYKVSDLIYYEGPILSHYINSKGTNFLFHWCDVDDDYNRWIVFQVSLIHIHEYLEKKYSLSDLFNIHAENVVYVLDLNDNLEISKCLITDYSNIPPLYKPTTDSYYNFTPRISDNIDEYYLNVSESGILQAIFRNSKRIGYGTIPMDYLSPTLHHLNEINNGLGNAYYKQKNKNRPALSGNRKVPKYDKNEIVSQTQFEIAGAGPGSFKLFLRPLVSQKSIGEESTETDNYFNFFMRFIESSFEYEKLQKVVTELPIEVIHHYEKLLKNMEVNRFDFLLKWRNPISKQKIEVSIEQSQVNTALENINKLEYQNSEELDLVGRFVELNILTKHYTFIQDRGDDKIESRGYFDEMVKDGIMLVQFNKVYEVKIARKESKEAGEKNPKVKDILRSFYEVK